MKTLSMSVQLKTLATRSLTAQSDLIDLIKEHLNIRSDTKLACVLETSPSYIYHLRHNVTVISHAYILRFHELTVIPIRELKSYLGLPCLTSLKGPK